MAVLYEILDVLDSQKFADKLDEALQITNIGGNETAFKGYKLKGNPAVFYTNIREGTNQGVSPPDAKGFESIRQIMETGKVNSEILNSVDTIINLHTHPAQKFEGINCLVMEPSYEDLVNSLGQDSPINIIACKNKQTILSIYQPFPETKIIKISKQKYGSLSPLENPSIIRDLGFNFLFDVEYPLDKENKSKFFDNFIRGNDLGLVC